METMTLANHKRFESNGHEFVYLTKTGSIFEVPPEIKPVLDAARTGKTFDRERLNAMLQGDEEERRSQVQDLIVNCVVEPSDTAGTDGWEYRFDTPVNTLVLHVTESCNLACTYCYHGQKGTGNQEARVMDSSVARKSVDFLIERSGDQEKLVLVFFGGEPLLNFELIKKTVAYADKRAAESGKQVDYAMTTNATLLTDSVIRFLRENNMGVTISLDGTESVHDRFRCYPGGVPSYRAILPGIKKLLNQKNQKPVVARVTLAAETGNIAQTCHHLLDLGFAEAGFAPVTTTDPCFMLDARQMKSLLDQFEGLSQEFVERALEGGFLGFTNLVDMLVQLHEGDVRQYPCGAGIGMFSVDPSGSLFLCQRLTHDPSAFMGDIFNGPDHARLNSFRHDARVSNKTVCRNCWVSHLCAGGCYHEAKIREGSLMSPNRHYCRWIRSWTEIGLQVYARLTIEAPDYLDKLSMLRGHAPLPELSRK